MMKRNVLAFIYGIIFTIVSIADVTEETKICDCGRIVASADEAADDSIITYKCIACVRKHAQLEEDDVPRADIKHKRPDVDIQQSLEFMKTPLKKDLQHQRKLLDDVDNIKLMNPKIYNAFSKKDHKMQNKERYIPDVNPKYSGSVTVTREIDSYYESLEYSVPKLNFEEIYKLSNPLGGRGDIVPKSIPRRKELGTENIHAVAIRLGFSQAMMHHIKDKELNPRDIDSILDRKWDNLKIVDVKRGGHFDIRLPLDRDNVARVFGTDCGMAFRGNRNDDERISGETYKMPFRVRPVRILAKIPISLDTIKKLRDFNY